MSRNQKYRKCSKIIKNITDRLALGISQQMEGELNFSNLEASRDAPWTVSKFATHPNLS